VDRESLAILQREAASAEGLPLSLSDRLRGESFGELRSDAKQALRDFGLVTQERTEDGRFAGVTFNDMIRTAAGRAPADSQPEQPTGDLGIGRGNSASIMSAQEPPPSMSALIRAQRDMRNEEMRARARGYDAMAS
jgi:hypothetical protein